jgi:hypothetical protein
MNFCRKTTTRDHPERRYGADCQKIVSRELSSYDGRIVNGGLNHRTDDTLFLSKGCLRRIFLWCNESYRCANQTEQERKEVGQFAQRRTDYEKLFDSLDPGTEYAFYAWSGINTSGCAGCCEDRPYASSLLPPSLLSSRLLPSRTSVLQVLLPIRNFWESQIKMALANIVRAIFAEREQLFAGGVLNDFGEGFRIEAGSADESSVDVVKGAESVCVVGFDRAAV